MPTENTKKKTSKLDPKTAQSAFESMSQELAALRPDEVVTPNSDGQQAAVAALALVDIMAVPSRAKQFESLPIDLLAKHAAQKLELAALATWYASTCLQDQQALATGAKVSVEVMDRATALRAKLLKQLEYHLDELPQAMAQLADIRTGTGYQDTASDLSRLGRMHVEHKALIDRDPRYNANDGATAQAIATEIIEALRESMGREIAEWNDKRNRAFTIMSGLYADIVAAAQFVFRKEPSALALFVPLKTAATVHSRTTSSAQQGAGAPAVPVPTPDNGLPVDNGAPR